MRARGWETAADARRRDAVGRHACPAHAVRKGLGRSRAWGVLAVSLALMALVAALSSTTAPRSMATASRGTDARGEGAASSPTSVDRRPAEGTAPSSTLPAAGGAAGARSSAAGAGSTQTPDSGGSAARVDAGPGNLGTASAGAAIDESPGAAAPGLPAIPPATGAATPPGGTSASTVLPTAAPYPGPGNIEAPTVSAEYPVAGGGTVSATATWSGTPTMTLSIACPDGAAGTRSGSSGLSLTVDDSSGGSAPCQVTIALPPGADSTVSYTLAIEPAPGA